MAANNLPSALAEFLHAHRLVDIKEVGIVLQPELQLSSTPGPECHFLFHDGHVGIASSVVLNLYEQAESLLLHHKAARQPAGLAAEELAAVAAATQAMLLVNAQHDTAWHARKRLVLGGSVNLDEELQLCRLVLLKHPKTDCGWAHRRWCLRARVSSSGRTSIDDTLLNAELQLCTRVAETYPRNFYAWSHRQWVMKELSLSEHWAADRQFVKAWTASHISDNCGLHHVYFLLVLQTRTDPEHALALDTPRAACLRSQPSDCRCCAMWREDRSVCVELLNRYPEHEALWSHLRYLVQAMHRLSRLHGTDVELLAGLDETLNPLQYHTTQLWVTREQKKQDFGSGSAVALEADEKKVVFPVSFFFFKCCFVVPILIPFFLRLLFVSTLLASSISSSLTSGSVSCTYYLFFSSPFFRCFSSPIPDDSSNYNNWLHGDLGACLG